MRRREANPSCVTCSTRWPANRRSIRRRRCGATARVPKRKRFYQEAGVARRRADLPSRSTASRSRRRRAASSPCRCARLRRPSRRNGARSRSTIDPLTMPLTRFANSVVEAVVDRVTLVRDDVAKYLAFRSAVLSRRPSRGAGREGGRALGPRAVLGRGYARRAFHSRRGHHACAPARHGGRGGARGAAGRSLVGGGTPCRDDPDRLGAAGAGAGPRRARSRSGLGRPPMSTRTGTATNGASTRRSPPAAPPARSISTPRSNFAGVAAVG